MAEIRQAGSSAIPRLGGVQKINDRLSGSLPLLAIAVTVILWASAFVAIRHVGKEISAGGLALGRLLVAAAVLGLVILLRRRPAAAGADGSTLTAWPRGRAWWNLLTVGVVWFGLYNIALNEGERHVDAGTAAMIVNVGPILIAVLAGAFLGEGFPRKLIIGSLVAFGGVVLIGVSSSSGTGTSLWGAALCLFAAIAYAVGVVTQKPLLGQMQALRVTWLACLIGAAVCLPFAGDLVNDLRTASLPALGWVVYLGVMPTAVGFLTWAYALARSTAGRLGASTYLVPPLAVLMGWALLGETPAALAIAGGAVCLVGVAIARRRS
ncbi:MAG: DMT family transporter [Hamadaea sp.]|nr:DMT family transporter [Hamadaea sp.]